MPKLSRTRQPVAASMHNLLLIVCEHVPQDLISTQGLFQKLMNSSVEPDIQKTGLSVAVYKVLKAMARFTLRRGMSVSAMNELARRAYLSAAMELIQEENARTTTSRICAMTGMYRREIRRLESLPPLTDQETSDKLNRTSRVVSGWLRDSEFHTASGNPVALSPEGDKSFELLVKKYSGDITPTAIKQELERLGIISTTKRGLIKLEKSVYLNSTEEHGVNVLGTDTSDLIETIAHNIDQSAGHDPGNDNGQNNTSKLFQRKVAYINVPVERVPEFQQYAATESQKLLETLDKWLSRLTASATTTDKYRVGVGIYQFQSKQRRIDDSLIEPATGQTQETSAKPE